jgi:glycerol-3-phosphate O-acyltransferase
LAEHRTRKEVEHGADRDYAISVGLRMLTLRHLVIEADDTWRANPKELVLLQYYANAIVHLFKDREVRTGRDGS